MLSTIEKILFLRSVELFEKISDEHLGRVAQVAQEVQFKKDERFIRQGDPGDCLYIIVNGEVNIVVDGVGQIAVRGEKSVHGEMAILTSQPRSANCVAGTDLTALKIGQDDFFLLLGEEPELSLGIIKVLADRLVEADRRAAE